MATVSGGLAMRGGVAGGGSAVFAVQAASLKGEDKFIAEPDVRRWMSATARKRRGAETRGDLLACFAVFDGHVNASASSHAERRMLPALLECGADEPEALLETSCVSAFESVERSFKRGGTCGACFSRSGRGPEGGSTACVVLLQRRRAPAGPRLDVVAANAGDSGALLVHLRDRADDRADGPDARADSRSPAPPDDDAPASFTRLTRDHNPDDPLEAARLADAGARLGRMRKGGVDVGPMRSYPGGLAVSRALGDFGSPAVVCLPEVTRHHVPPRGARVVIASDGLWNAMIDAEVAKTTADASTPEEAADALMRSVVERRGLHDDVTIVVVDIPEPARAFDDDEDDTGDRTTAAVATEPRSRSDGPARKPPPPAAPSIRAARRVVEADVTVRRGLSFDGGSRALANGVGDGGGEDDDEARKRGGKRGGGGGIGCFSFLCGSGSGGDSALDAVDDAFSDGSLLDDYDLGAVLGRGQYGSVRIAYLRPGRRGSEDVDDDVRGASAGHPSSSSRRAFAVKSVATDGARSSLDRVRKEVDTMLAVSGRHPCLPVVHAAYEQTSPGGVRVVHIVTDAYLGGDLVEGVARRGAMTARDWETVAAQLLGAVHFLHAVGVVHRDVKPENVMLKRAWVGAASPRVALVDFGSAAFARGAGKEDALRGFAGTKFFGAPECFRGVGAHGAKSDVWSLAVTLLALLVGTPPTRDVDAAWRELQRGSIPPSMRPGDDVPPRLLELVRFMLVADPRERPDASEALARAPWLLREEERERSERERDGNAESRGGAPSRLSRSVVARASAETGTGTGTGTGDEALAGAGLRAAVDAARARYRRSAAFVLSVLLDARRAKKLVAELRRGSSSRDENDAAEEEVSAATLEAALRTVGAADAAMQLELLAEQVAAEACADAGADADSTDPDSTDASANANAARAVRDSLSVETRRVADLAELHARHRRVYEAVAGGASTRDGALRDEQRARRRLNAGDSVHAGMLMAMLTRVSSRTSLSAAIGGERRGGSGSNSNSNSQSRRGASRGDGSGSGRGARRAEAEANDAATSDADAIRTEEVVVAATPPRRMGTGLPRTDSWLDERTVDAYGRG